MVTKQKLIATRNYVNFLLLVGNKLLSLIIFIIVMENIFNSYSKCSGKRIFNVDIALLDS